MVEAEAEAGLARLAAGRRRPTGKYYSWSSPYRAASSRQHRAPCFLRASRDGRRRRAARRPFTIIGHAQPADAHG